MIGSMWKERLHRCDRITRREMLGLSLRLSLCGIVAGMPGLALSQDDGPRIPRNPLGSLKIPVSMVGLSGWKIGEVHQEATALAVIARALQLGINYFDTAASYGTSNEGENRLGAALEKKRKEVVICTKTFHRDSVRSEEALEASLKRLRTDYVDVWMFQEVSQEGELDVLMGSGGALEVARKALEDGRVKMIGASSHSSPVVLNRIMELIPEVSILQFPVNCLDPNWRSFIRTVLPNAKERGVSVIGTKPFALGMINRLTNVGDREALRYALSQNPTSLLLGPDDPERLEQLLDEVRDFRPMSGEDQAALLERTRPYSGPGFETYKAWAEY